MIVDGIKIYDGYLVQSTYLPHGSSYNDFNSFHKVAKSSKEYICIELPPSLNDRGWNHEPWCEKDKTYWQIVNHNNIKQIKGYFSDGS